MCLAPKVPPIPKAPPPPPAAPEPVVAPPKIADQITAAQKQAAMKGTGQLTIPLIQSMNLP